MVRITYRRWFAPVAAGLVACTEPATLGDPPTPSLGLATLGGEVLLHRYADDALDESGNGNHGSVSGDATYIDGPIDRAIALDGDGDLVTVDADATLEPATVTVEACFNPAVTLTAGFPFVPIVVKLPAELQFGAAVDGYDLTFQDETAQGGKVNLVFGIGSDGGATRVPAKVETDLEGGLYHHLAGTYDGTQMKLYLNGALVRSRDHGDPIAYLGGPLKVGGGIQNLIQVPSGEAQYFAGEIEEVAIFDRALSAAEVESRSQRCIGTFTPEDLIATLRDVIAQLASDGVLNEGQANALSRKLDSTARFLNKGNPQGASNTLGAFQNQVASLEAEGILDAATAETLISLAQDAVDQLGS